MTARPQDATAGAPAIDRPSSWVPSREARRQRGKALRQDCPRSSQGKMIVGQAQRDPLGLLEASNGDRVENLLPLRFTRMAESPFAFFRGTAVLQAYDLQGTPSAGIEVQCCGDCHLMNFGGFATPERALVFDINDFDETLRAPFEWDVKRLTTSFILAGRWLGFKDRDCRCAAASVAGSYRQAMAGFAELSVLETWYAKIAFEEVLQDADSDDVRKLLKKNLKKAAQSTSEQVFHKLTTVKNGQPRIVDEPPLLFHSPNHDKLMKEDIEPFFESYRNTLPADRRVLFDQYRVLDMAFKVVGVGSVGTRCAVVLCMDMQDEPLFLQVKEARPSVLEGRAGPSPFQNNGERIVTGQRVMQSASDIFLGWSRGHEGRDCYVRQLRDMKIAPQITQYSPGLLESYGTLCGRSLARAHAKSGEAAGIAGYLGSSEAFEVALADYAVGYADQVEQDYQSFVAATRTGRFPIETLPSEMEAMIR